MKYIDRTWNLDLWLVGTIVESLRYFNGRVTGYPACFESEDEWQTLIECIVEHFEFYLENSFDWDSEALKRLEYGFDLLKEWLPGMWN